MQGGSIPTYYISHTITVEKIDTAVDAISEISANIQRDHKRETVAEKTFQVRVWNNQLSPRAQQIFDDAKNQTPTDNLATMSTTERRAYLAKIFKKKSLGEVEDMWKNFLPVINFKVMYNVSNSAPAEHADLMKSGLSTTESAGCGRWRTRLSCDANMGSATRTARRGTHCERT